MVHERFESSGWVPPWIRYEHQARYDFVARHVSGRVVIDCASGDGTGASVFARAGAISVQGFDISADAVQLARARHPGIAFQQANAVDLPIPSRSVDVFVSLETIEHIDTGEHGARAFVQEAARVLKPDGVFICSTPDRSVYNPGKPPSATPWNRFHVREYDRAEFTALLSRRFARVEMYAQNPHSQLFARALHVVGRSPGHFAVRWAQIAKVARAPFDRPAAHTVIPAHPATPYEYLVAVCSRPT